MNCDRCNGDTKTKFITSKKDGKKYQMWECLEGCKEGKWPYAFFPPRERNYGKSQPERQPSPKPAAGGDAVSLLRSIDTSLKNLVTIMQVKTGVVAVQETELQPDDEIPF